MAISFSCIACGKKYKVADTLAGKTAKCPGCGQPIKIPQLSTSPSGQSQPRGTAKRQAKKSVVPEGKEFGLTGIQREDDFFAGAGQPVRGNPLGEQVQDYGIVEQPVEQETKTTGDLDIPDFGENPAISEFRKMQAETARREGKMPGAKGGSASGGKAKAGSGGGAAGSKMKGLFSSPAKIAAVILLPVELLLGLLGIILAVTGVGIAPIIPGIGVGVGCLVQAGAQVWGLIKAFQNSKDRIAEAILYLLIPFYVIFYWIKYWPVMKQPVLVILIGTLGAIVGAVSMGICFAVVGS